jgi:hypothetical protein
VIIATLDLMDAGKHVAGGIERALAAAERIRDVVRDMHGITRIESAAQWPADVPKMLDLRRSGGLPEGDRPSRGLPSRPDDS